MRINENYGNLKENYLFSDIARKVNEYKASHPDADVIRLGIGDVTLPLCKSVVDAMVKATLEMGKKETFRGYGDEQGYSFLQEAVAGYYKNRGVSLDISEIFISDGAKSDLGNMLDLFSTDNTALIPDPVYPVYVDTNIMAGRKIAFLNANEENGFLPLPDENTKGDIVYICSPNNPTGAVYDREGLKKWVDWANACGAVILFDAAYEAFISDDSLPHSIYEIEGARTCAVEVCSLSKTAGFTGTRCGYTVVPEALIRGGKSLRKMWLRRQTTKFNGVPYIVQRGARAVFTDAGQREIMENIAYYKENARIIADALGRAGIAFSGGVHSPYIWLRCPGGMTSWEYFDLLLNKANVVGTPGAGFGKNGEGYLRLTAFGDRGRIKEAVERILKL
ncbi:MAG: LL-diaminopimelate aminotransferase, partial [Clostridia bacterium]|nr:LL-diaminopimelate aminotransferase [Clostridia bacterium]